jgi:hypothetical protein
LPDQKIPRTEKHGARLLFLSLDRDKAHRRPARRLGNRFRISGIVLLSLDEGLPVYWWDQSNLVTEVADGSPPVVRAPAGLHGIVSHDVV